MNETKFQKHESDKGASLPKIYVQVGRNHFQDIAFALTYFAWDIRKNKVAAETALDIQNCVCRGVAQAVMPERVDPGRRILIVVASALEYHRHPGGAPAPYQRTVYLAVRGGECIEIVARIIVNQHVTDIHAFVGAEGKAAQHAFMLQEFGHLRMDGLY